MCGGPLGDRPVMYLGISWDFSCWYLAFHEDYFGLEFDTSNSLRLGRELIRPQLMKAVVHWDWYKENIGRTPCVLPSKQTSIDALHKCIYIIYTYIYIYIYIYTCIYIYMYVYAHISWVFCKISPHWEVVPSFQASGCQ